MRREPLLLPFLALAAGVVAGHFNYFRLSELTWPLILTAVLMAVCLALPRARRVREFPLLMALALLGIGTQVIHRQGLPPKLTVPDGEIALLDGCVIDSPVFGGEKLSLRWNWRAVSPFG